MEFQQIDRFFDQLDETPSGNITTRLDLLGQAKGEVSRLSSKLRVLQTNFERIERDPEAKLESFGDTKHEQKETGLMTSLGSGDEVSGEETSSGEGSGHEASGGEETHTDIESLVANLEQEVDGYESTTCTLEEMFQQFCDIRSELEKAKRQLVQAKPKVVTLDEDGDEQEV